MSANQEISITVKFDQAYYAQVFLGVFQMFSDSVNVLGEANEATWCHLDDLSSLLNAINNESIESENFDDVVELQGELFRMAIKLQSVLQEMKDYYPSSYADKTVISLSQKFEESMNKFRPTQHEADGGTVAEN